jgi:hypothetical protein
MSVVAGEESQETGRDGLKEAKRWLEMSTRVRHAWTHKDKPMSELLAFRWPGSPGTFTFDLGGVFRGDGLHNQSFLAEVKNYKKELDLPTHYRDFVAKCYVAFLSNPDRCGHFLWLSWSPFQAQAWDRHTSVDRLEKHLLHRENRLRVLGVEDADAAKAAIDPQAIVEVSRRIWLLTLCHQQEGLILTRDHYAEVIKMIMAEAV